MEGIQGAFEHSEAFPLRRVPQFLSKSLYYLACLENVDQSESDSALYDVPLHCRKVDTSVQTHADLQSLLLTIRFWCLSEMPVEIIDYCLKTKFGQTEITPLLIILTEFKENFIEVNQLKNILFNNQNSWNDSVSRCNTAIELNCKCMLEILIANSDVLLSGDHWSEMVTTAAQYDRLDCLIYLHTTAKIYSFTEFPACAAAGAGAVACLQYILKHSREGVKKSWLIPASAVRAGKVECLKCAHLNGCQMAFTIISFAIEENQIECLEYALSVQCPYAENASTTAAGLGHLECLQLLHTYGCEFDSTVCECAAGRNHLSCLIFAHTHGSELNEESHFRALKHGYLDIIKYVYEAGIPFSRRLCHTAIYHGQLECLKFMIENGCPWVEEPLKEALQFKQQEIYEYALQCGFV